MVDRDKIEAAVRDDLEVIETGDWHIAAGSYNGTKSAEQSDEGREAAIQALVDRFYEREERRQRIEKGRKREMENIEELRELHDKKVESILDDTKRYPR